MPSNLHRLDDPDGNAGGNASDEESMDLRQQNWLVVRESDTPVLLLVSGALDNSLQDTRHTNRIMIVDPPLLIFSYTTTKQL